MELRKNKFDLTQGSILNKLLLVALPIMGTQFMQMTYNLTDMFWLGRLSSDAVAASGTAGMYLWLSQGIMMFGRTGAEIGVAQSMGKGESENAAGYAETSFSLSVILGVMFMAVLMIGRNPLVSFFKIQEAHVVQSVIDYMVIVSIGIPFTFASSVLSGAFSGFGNTKTPFYINCIGLLINMILDPLFIFTFHMGITGAAIATIVAQIIVCLLLVWALVFSKKKPFDRFRLFQKPKRRHLRDIWRWGLPVSVESLLFTFLSMLISRMVPPWGSGAIAVQKVGSQIESLSWLISGGFATAVTAFIGQNFGAGKWSRIHKGYKISIYVMIVWGAAVTILMFFFAEPLMSVFLKDQNHIQMGGEYLRILSGCQLVACLEYTTAGCFRGIGKTLPPSIVSVCSNIIRVPLAYFLSRTSLGLNGIWVALTLGAVLRGLWVFIWYLIDKRKMPKGDMVLQ